MTEISKKMVSMFVKLFSEMLNVLTVILEKTIPVAVKNKRGWISRMLAGDKMAQAQNRNTIKKNDNTGTSPSRNARPRSVLETRALCDKWENIKLFL